MAVIAGFADEFGVVGELSRELFSTVNTHMYKCTHTGTSLAKRKEVWCKHMPSRVDANTKIGGHTSLLGYMLNDSALN